MINKTSHRLLIGLSFIICHLSFSVALTSCAGEEEAIFDKSAAERLNESSAKYSARLEAQPNGWAMQYYPTYNDEAPYGSGYLILMRFNPDFSVDVSMDNRFSNNTYATATSAWEVIKDNGPVLSFNTFNACMHAFSDPEDISWTGDDEQSEGCGGDYEFIIVDAPEDASYMMLKGKKRNTYNLLTPVEVGVDYQEYLADVKAFHNKMFQANASIGNLICFGPDSIYNMDDSNDGVPNIYPLGSDAIANESFNPFLITKRGNDYYLRFRDAFEKDYLEGKLQELRYDPTQDKFIGTDNPAFIIQGYPAPEFFAKYTNAKGDRMIDIITTENAMSPKFKTYIDNLTAGFAQMKNKNKAYGFVGLRYMWNAVNKSFQWQVRYTPGTNTPTSVGYNYTPEMTSDGVKFIYEGPGADAKGATTAAENVRKTLSSVADITDLLSQQFIVKAADTNFDLTQLRFTSTTDSDLWFVVYVPQASDNSSSAGD